ncbi:MAG: hypothetical protein ACRD1G_11305 [Acidimicrobiales bacterium]
MIAADLTAFPLWIVIAHLLNIVFMLFLLRSDLEIVSAFPKFYLSDDCPPGKEWLRLTRRVYSADAAHPWSSLDEEEPWLPSPVERIWGWVAMALHDRAVLDGHRGGLYRPPVRHRIRVTLVPTHWSISPDAAKSVGTYVHFRVPANIPGQPFDAIQKPFYFVVIFILAPSRL